MTSASKYKHVFIDLDKTLWDFDRNSLQTLREIFEKYRLESLGIPGFDAFLPVYTDNNLQLWDIYRKNGIEKEELNVRRFDISLKHWNINDHDLAKGIAYDYVKLSPQKTNLFPGTIEALNYLRSKYILHIITNGFDEVQHPKIDNSGLRKYFSTITISEEAGVKKPEKEIFQLALSKASTTESESIMIGDDPDVDISGARNIGMDQLFFNPEKLETTDEATYEINSWQEIDRFL